MIMDETDLETQVEAEDQPAGDKPEAEVPKGEEAQEQEVKAETEGESGSDDNPDPDKPKAKAQDPKDKELAYYRRRAERAERDTRELNRQLAEENARLKAESQRAAPRAEAAARPKSEDFTSVDDYVEALTDWKIAQDVVPKLQQNQQHQGRATQAEQARAAAAEKWQAQVEQGQEEFDDFEDVAFDFPQTETMAAAIVDSDIGYRIAHYLGNNHAEASKIARMTPGRQWKAIDRIEAKINGQKPRATNAKEPPSKVTRGSGGDVGRTVYSKDLTPEQYRALREKKASAG